MQHVTIHPTAILDGDIALGDGCIIGPFALLQGTISLGENCRVGPRVTLLGLVTAGDDNAFHTGCVIGDTPQHLAFAGEPTRVVLGHANTLREYVTIHRGMPNGLGTTTLGDKNFLMANSHVAHDCIVGDRAVFANSAVVGGHAVVGDGAFLSGNSCVHQFCRVGELAMLSGTSSISQDLPPFWIVQGVNTTHGVNIVGMRRAGYSHDEIQAVRVAYKRITRSGQAIRESCTQLEAEYPTSRAIAVLVEFIRTSKRGICSGGADE